MSDNGQKGGTDMPKVMKCRHCEEVLVCSACGVRQTPTRVVKKSTSVAFTDEVKEQISEAAQEMGISVSVYLAKLAVAAGKKEGK